jgi:hypothetical protein
VNLFPGAYTGDSSRNAIDDDEWTKCWADIPAKVHIPGKTSPLQECGADTKHPTGLCDKHFAELKDRCER